jgi:hypothetical protein
MRRAAATTLLSARPKSAADADSRPLVPKLQSDRQGEGMSVHLKTHDEWVHIGSVAVDSGTVAK